MGLALALFLDILFFALFFGGFIVFGVGVELTEHQAARQLRRLPLYGDWATRHDEGITNALGFLVCCLSAALWYTVGGRLARLGLPVGLMAACAVYGPLTNAETPLRTARRCGRGRAGCGCGWATPRVPRRS